MDLTQIVLLLMIIVLGATLTLVGVQLFFILREAEKSLRKTNLVLDDLQTFSSNLSSGSESLRGLLSALPFKGGGLLAFIVTVSALAKNFFGKSKKD